MELLVPPKHLCTISRLSFFPSYLNPAFSGNNVSCRRRFSGYSNRISVPLRITIRSEYDSISNSHLNQESEADCEILNGKSSNFVDVIGIGSRKDAVLDFCLESPFQSLTSLRFWNILLKESMRVELQQRSLEQGVILQYVEGRVSLLSSSQAVILMIYSFLPAPSTTTAASRCQNLHKTRSLAVLDKRQKITFSTLDVIDEKVASAGYGLDQNTAIELLRAVKSADKLAIGIILKPFSFEGQRRQDEVTDLVNKLQEHTHFCIVVDTDALLKTEVVTLSEALKSANDAVLLAMNAIFILVSDRHKKIIDGLHCEMKELKIQEALELLKNYKRAKVGFGAGNNLKSSIVRAIYDCPFLDGGMKDIDMVVCTIASSDVMGDDDLRAFLRTFRQTTRFEKDIVVSVACEPNLEPNLILTTVITLCCNEQNVSQKKGFLSNLALHFPFVLSFLGKEHPESKDTLPAHSLGNTYPSEIIEASGSGDLPNSNSVNGTSESLDLEKLQTLLGSNYDENSDLSDDEQKKEDGNFKGNEDFISNVQRQTTEEEPAFQREPLISRTVGPGFHIAREWAKERALSGAAPVLDKHSVFTLPVGVKPVEQSTGSPKFPNTPQPSEPRVSNDINGISLNTQDMRSWDSLTDAGVEAVKEIYNTASTLLKGKSGDSPKKQGVLSVRAASMLEAERDSEKKWSPITEMQYRGGIYRGRCQGGLPEGKGRLTVLDGSIYDGMWRYGKKYGPGTLYYSNGDVFQGTWRDDLMHGRGWFYFHTGDRWFVNFWKGTANGEGRFYSKTGEIFFGHFQDGWRHGHSLFIDVDGRRWAEIWDEGVLLSREHMDSEVSADITPQK